MKTRTFEGFTFQVLEPAESYARAIPLFGRVFVLAEDGGLDNFAIFPRGKPPRIFRNADWQVVALVGTPFFAEDEDSLRGKPQWYRELHGRDHLAPLLRILQDRGTPHVYLAHIDEPAQQETLLAPPRRPELNAAWYSDDLLATLCSFAVDDHADWGLVADEYCMYLGGEPALMQRFIAESGGLDELIRLFSMYIEGPVTPGEPGYTAGGARFHRRLYDYLGWPWPFAEPPPSASA